MPLFYCPLHWEESLCVSADGVEAGDSRQTGWFAYHLK
jgi:hypothetical protein